ncbi:MAG: polysaccharide deacetylase family protein [Akkermansia sp.]
MIKSFFPFLCVAFFLCACTPEPTEKPVVTLKTAPVPETVAPERPIAEPEPLRPAEPAPAAEQPPAPAAPAAVEAPAAPLAEQVAPPAERIAPPAAEVVPAAPAVAVPLPVPTPRPSSSEPPVGLRVARVPVSGMYVALTFDDGPSPAQTPQALEILRRNGAHGTFFVTGENASRNKALLARMVAEGHEIGVHSWSHVQLTRCSAAKLDREIAGTAEVIRSATGRAPKLMRPPYGATNAALNKRMMADYGLRTILWDVDTLDWRHPGVQRVIDTAVGKARPGSIILVHDIHASTIAALEGIVQGLQARGFKLVTVSQLIALSSSGAEPAAAESPAALPTELPAAAEEAPVRPAEPASGAASIGVPPAAPTEAVGTVAELPGATEGAATIRGEQISE